MAKHEKSTVEPPEAAKEAAPGFELGTWKGMTQWRCATCGWETLTSEAAMLAHIQQQHAPPPPPPPSVTVYDRWGREVKPPAPAE